MEIVIFKKNENKQLTKDIHLSDFQCKCENCRFVPVCMDHLNKVQYVADKIGKKFRINSGRRCCGWNFSIGGESESMHIIGIATDLSIPDANILDYKLEFEIFDGLGIYRSFIHCDSRGFQKARWTGK